MVAGPSFVHRTAPSGRAQTTTVRPIIRGVELVVILNGTPARPVCRPWTTGSAAPMPVTESRARPIPAPTTAIAARDPRYTARHWNLRVISRPSVIDQVPSSPVVVRHWRNPS